MTKRRDYRLARLITPSVWYSLLLALMAMLGGALLAPLSAHAAPRTGNYQLTVQVTNGPFSYGGSTLPNFQATLTALNGATLSSCTPTGTFYVTVTVDTDPGSPWASTSHSASGANTCVYTYVDEPSAWGNYAVGLRTVTAQATISGQVVATGTATFTVNKIVTTTSCGINNPGTVYQAGSTLQITQQVQGPTTGYSPDWTQSTFNVTFTGPASVTYSNVTPDTAPGTGWLSVQAPATPGQYTMKCTFNGEGDYAPSTSGSGAVEISAFHQIAGIKLYTNPTTYNPYQSCDVYIVFQPAPGGPTPTGRTSITIGPNYSPEMTIASNGTLSVRLSPLQLPGEALNQIKIDYTGDTYYRWTSSTFSFTNPAISNNAPASGGGTSGGGKGGASQATTTATAQDSPSGPTPASSGTQNASAGSSSSGSSRGSSLLWIGLAVLVLALGGGVLALLMRARLAKSKFNAPYEAPQSDRWPPYPDEPTRWQRQDEPTRWAPRRDEPPSWPPASW
jgi:hypothetical protein